jgi:hypothetical protein
MLSICYTLFFTNENTVTDDIYKHINATVHYDGFDQKSEKYQYRVTWVNPPKSVDYYQISVTTTERPTAISRIIKAVRMMSFSGFSVIVIEF